MVGLPASNTVPPTSASFATMAPEAASATFSPSVVIPRSSRASFESAAASGVLTTSRWPKPSASARTVRSTPGRASIVGDADHQVAAPVEVGVVHRQRMAELVARLGRPRDAVEGLRQGEDTLAAAVDDVHHTRPLGTVDGRLRVSDRRVPDTVTVEVESVPEGHATAAAAGVAPVSTPSASSSPKETATAPRLQAFPALDTNTP